MGFNSGFKRLNSVGVNRKRLLQRFVASVSRTLMDGGSHFAAAANEPVGELYDVSGVLRPTTTVSCQVSTECHCDDPASTTLLGLLAEAQGYVRRLVDGIQRLWSVQSHV